MRAGLIVEFLESLKTCGTLVAVMYLCIYQIMEVLVVFVMMREGIRLAEVVDLYWWSMILESAGSVCDISVTYNKGSHS